MTYIITTNSDPSPGKKGRLHSGKLWFLKMQGKNHGDKQLNWKICCCGMSAVLPLDRSIREVGETREAVSKCALLEVLRLKWCHERDLQLLILKGMLKN